MQFNEILTMYKSSANVICSNCYDIQWITWVSDSIHIWNNSELKEDPENILNAWKNNKKNCFRDCCLLFNINIGLVNTCYKSCRLVDFTTLNTKVHSHRGSIKINNTEKCLQSARKSLGFLQIAWWLHVKQSKAQEFLAIHFTEQETLSYDWVPH